MCVRDCGTIFPPKVKPFAQQVSDMVTLIHLCLNVCRDVEKVADMLMFLPLPSLRATTYCGACVPDTGQETERYCTRRVE